MMNMVGLNFQLPIAKQIWLFEDLKIHKKENRIEICKGLMKNLTCDSTMCITTSFALWPWCMPITNGHKILILMLNFWIWTNKNFQFKNDAMCNVQCGPTIDHTQTTNQLSKSKLGNYHFKITKFNF
jgi:hypothetical protein